MKRFSPLILLAGILLAGALWLFLRPDPHREARGARALATRGLAEHLARTFPGQRALVVANPFTREKGMARGTVDMEEAGLRGLRAGFGQRLVLEAVAFPELKPGALENPRALLMDGATTTPLSYLVTDGAFDQLARQHPACELIVSLIGLPAELERVDCWRTPGRPRFALLLPDLRIIGDDAAVRSAVQSGKLVAFVCPRPGVSDTPVNMGEDIAVEFEKRFVLVTAANFDQVIQIYPNLFMTE